VLQVDTRLAHMRILPIAQLLTGSPENQGDTLPWLLERVRRQLLIL
jgi:hypothetical protein